MRWFSQRPKKPTRNIGPQDCFINEYNHRTAPNASSDGKETYVSLVMSHTGPSIKITQWEPCWCSDGDCEMGSHVKYEITIGKETLKEICSLKGL